MAFLSVKQEALINAIRNNKVQAVIELIKPSGLFGTQQVNPNFLNPCDETPLFEAVNNGLVAITEALLQYGARVDEPSTVDKSTPLLMAAANGYEKICEILLKAGAKVNLGNEGGLFPLLMAASKGHVKICETLLKVGADVNQVSGQRASALMCAAQGGHANVIEVLLKAGANVNQTAKEGISSLWKAAEKGDEKSVRALLAVPGINLHFKTSSGPDVWCNTTALEIAQKKGHSIVADLISDALDVEAASPLWRAAYHGDVTTIEQLLKKGDTVNQVSKNRGKSLLYVAAENGHEQAVNALIKAKVDVNQANKKGTSPLFIALYNCHEKIAEILIQTGANINQTNIEGSSPLYIAACKGLANIIPLLIKAGADINQANKQGYSALSVAASNGYDKVVEILSAAGAKVNQIDPNGCSPLYLAVLKSHEKVVRVLLMVPDIDLHAKTRAGSEVWANETALKCAQRLGHHAAANLIKEVLQREETLFTAIKSNQINEVVQLIAPSEPSKRSQVNTNVISEQGETPLMHAAKSSDVAIIYMLLDYGAKINQTDKDGRTATYIAANSGNIAALEALIKAKADINQTTKQGWTPLCIAAYSGQEKAITVLLKAGADINQTQADGKSPLFLAVENNQEKAVSVLLAAPGLYLNLKTRPGSELWANKTALEYAWQKKHHVIANLIAVEEQRQLTLGREKAPLLPLTNRANVGEADEIKILIQQAERGDQEAQANLGLKYDKGEGVPQDDVQAVQWYRKAAEQGSPMAQFKLGNMYVTGRGVLKDDMQAVHWYRKAAEQGLNLAQFNLGKMYFTGSGVPQDDTKAVYWYRKAAEQDYPEAQCNLGLMYASGRGVPKDEAQAAQCYRKAAEQGFKTGQFNLGVMYATGCGVPKDDLQAMQWYRKAAEQDYPNAQNILGWMYEKGRGVPKDDMQAVQWYRKAAEQGFAEAQNNLGRMFANGLGVTKDEAQAMQWYRKAAEQGSKAAQCNLGLYYEKGLGVSKDERQAAHWYRKAAEAGQPDAQNNLAVMYEQGRGVDKDLHQALMWYEKAAAQKHSKALEAVARLRPQVPVTMREQAAISPGKLEGEISKLPSATSAEKLATPLGTIMLSFTIPSNELTFGAELGRGGFGTVYKGTWRYNGVAIKQLHSHQLSTGAAEEFKQEMLVMSKLRSPNIIQLYGVVTDKAPYCLVMQYAEKGSLFNVLHSPENLSWTVRENIALDIAKGLAYLHHEKIIHRDLKSMNVLLDIHYRAKLTDFGLAKAKTEAASTSTNKLVGTLAWMAPELFGRRAVYNEKSDMYGYAMVIWELASRELPFKDAGNQQLIAKWVSDGEREDIPPETPSKLAKLITWGWKAKPAERPTAAEAIDYLQMREETSAEAVPAYQDNLSSGTVSDPRYLSNHYSQGPKG